MVQLVRSLSQLTGLTAALPTAEEAARLARADLATATVTESTALAGVIGAHLARAAGAADDVAEAIFEAVLLRYAGDTLPRSAAGTLVAIADRCVFLQRPPVLARVLPWLQHVGSKSFEACTIDGQPKHRTPLCWYEERMNSKVQAFGAELAHCEPSMQRLQPWE